MVSEPDTEGCASEDGESRRGVDREISHQLERGMSASDNAGSRRGVDSASDNAGSRRGVDCEIPHRLGMITKHSLEGCKNLSLLDTF